MIPNANTLLFRASGMGKLMTNDRSGKAMGDTAKTFLLEVYARENFGRYEEIQSKYLEKGNEREEDAITLLSRVTKKMYKKNTIRLKNDWFTGEPDLFVGPEIIKAKETNDTKASWSLINFLKAQRDPINKDYFYQGQTYMNLTGSRIHTISYCLVNGTYKAITDEKKKVAYGMGILDPSAKNNEKYIERCKQIERNHIFDLAAFMKEYPHFDLDNAPDTWVWDIPMELRLHQKTFEYEPKTIEQMQLRCLEGRNWLNKELFKC